MSTTLSEDPAHVAIIMDGNGRWAQRQGKSRIFGHRKGVEAVRKVVEACSHRGIPYLTLYAFSSENWKRPKEEVRLLTELLFTTLESEALHLHKNGIRLHVIGDLTPVMDATAFALCRDNGLAIRVLNINVPGNLRRAVCGEDVGTLVTERRGSND